MKAEISASMMCADFMDIKGDLEKLKDAGIEYLHFDIMDGDFVKYRSILPKEYKSKIILKTDDVYSSVERASILAKSQNEKVVKFSIEDTTLLITTASENGNAAETVDIFLEGKNIDISFNAKYLIDALRVIDSEDIIMEFNTNISPCVIRSDMDSSFLYLILPVHPR